MRLVIDASVTIRLLSNYDADDLLRRRFAPPRQLHAPHLLDAELASAIRGLLIGERISPERAETMMVRFSALRIIRHPMLPHMQRVIALRHNLTAYDAQYIALAEALGAPLLTLDAKFAGATGHRAQLQIYPYDQPRRLVGGPYPR